VQGLIQSHTTNHQKQLLGHFQNVSACGVFNLLPHRLLDQNAVVDTALFLIRSLSVGGESNTDHLFWRFAFVANWSALRLKDVKVAVMQRVL
jgi:hypothetical protein